MDDMELSSKEFIINCMLRTHVDMELKSSKWLLYSGNVDFGVLTDIRAGISSSHIVAKVDNIILHLVELAGTRLQRKQERKEDESFVGLQLRSTRHRQTIDSIMTYCEVILNMLIALSAINANGALHDATATPFTLLVKVLPLARARDVVVVAVLVVVASFRKAVVSKTFQSRFRQGLHGTVGGGKESHQSITQDDHDGRIVLFFQFVEL